MEGRIITSMGILAEERRCFGRWPIDRQNEFEILPGDNQIDHAWGAEEETAITNTINSFDGAKYRIWGLWREGYNYKKIMEKLGVSWLEVKNNIREGRREITRVLRNNR